MNCFKEEENSIFHLFLYQNLTSKCLKVWLNATHYFITKIPNRKELQLFVRVSRHLSDIDFKDFMKLYKEYTKDPCSF